MRGSRKHDAEQRFNFFTGYLSDLDQLICLTLVTMVIQQLKSNLIHNENNQPSSLMTSLRTAQARRKKFSPKKKKTPKINVEDKQTFVVLMHFLVWSFDVFVRIFQLQGHRTPSVCESTPVKEREKKLPHLGNI